MSSQIGNWLVTEIVGDLTNVNCNVEIDGTEQGAIAFAVSVNVIGEFNTSKALGV